MLTLILVTLLSASDEPSTAALVERLAASSETRFQAFDQLLVQGFKSLPQLRKTRDESSAEMRKIVSEAIQEIGNSRLLRGTKVKIECADLPTVDAIDQLARSSGFAFELPPIVDASWQMARLTIREPRELGFFEALDRLGEKAGFRASLRIDSAYPIPLGPSIRLVRTADPPPPVSYAGPYRLTFLSLNRHRVVTQLKPPANAGVSEELSARLEIVAEPGIVIQPHGTVRIREAVDQLGHDLRMGTSASSGAAENPSLVGTPDQLSRFDIKIPLNPQENGGQTLTRLRGFVPIVAMTRIDELFDAELSKSVGKTLSGGGTTLTIQNLNRDNLTTSMDIRIRTEKRNAPSAIDSGPRQATQYSTNLGTNLLDHVRVEDALGRPLPVSCHPTMPAATDGTLSYRLQIHSLATSSVPARLRYYGVAVVATEIPFDFRGLTLP